MNIFMVFFITILFFYLYIITKRVIGMYRMEHDEDFYDEGSGD